VTQKNVVIIRCTNVGLLNSTYGIIQYSVDNDHRNFVETIHTKSTQEF